jgi:hypothetical protein
MEAHLYAENYRQLCDDLAAHGWEVAEVQSFSTRDAIEAAQDVFCVYFRIVNDLGGTADLAAALLVLVTAIREHLRRPRRPEQPRRQTVIYGPDGKLLETVDLDEPEAPSAS